MNTLSGFGLNEFKHRTKKTNEDIAKILNCSPALVSQYSHGKSGISLERIEKLLQAGMLIDEAFSPETCIAIRKTEKGQPTTPGNGEPLDWRQELAGLKISYNKISGQFLELLERLAPLDDFTGTTFGTIKKKLEANLIRERLYQNDPGQSDQSDASNNPKG